MVNTLYIEIHIKFHGIYSIHGILHGILYCIYHLYGVNSIHRLYSSHGIYGI